MPASMSKGPLVSVITPTFNRAKLVAQAIDSVRQQTYQCWEMIIWDDGSTDETPRILQGYTDPRIQYCRGVNRGQAFARNQAIAKAHGKYLALLDDDDLWKPHKLARQVELMETIHPIDILFSNFENVDTVTGQTTVSFDANWKAISRMKTERVDEMVNMIAEGFLESFLQKNFILPSSTIMRKGILDTTGPFNEELRGTEDMEYWWRCGLRELRFGYLNEALVTRRVGRDNFCRNGARSLSEVIKALGYCLKETSEAGRDDLISSVRRTIGMSWEQLIKIYGLEGGRKEAVRAFRKRCEYGLTLRALALMVCAAAGPWTFKSLGK